MTAIDCNVPGPAGAALLMDVSTGLWKDLWAGWGKSHPADDWFSILVESLNSEWFSHLQVRNEVFAYQKTGMALTWLTLTQWQLLRADVPTMEHHGIFPGDGHLLPLLRSSIPVPMKAISFVVTH